MSVSDEESIPLLQPTTASRKRQSPEIRGGGAPDVVQRVPISKLQDQLRKLRDVVAGVGLDEPGSSGFVVDEITISAEVSATGEIGFLVAGAEATATGSIEITFRRASEKG